jgi:aryl-alcohol dehydrogenase-like predicted oxidoreductase
MVTSYSRRAVLKAGTLTGAGLALGGWHASTTGATGSSMITKAIPSTGERIPVVGVGTNQYGVETADELAARRAVLDRLPQVGGSVVDTAPAYGLSETVIGRLVAELGNRDRLFLATKLRAAGDDVAAARASIEQSFERLRTPVIDLMQVHNLAGTDQLAPLLQEQKAAQRIRYLGITTSRDEQHAEAAASLKEHRWDFVQVNYSIDDREAEREVLPVAQERGVAVLLNMPFGGRRGANLFARVAGRPMPGWAAEFDARSWAQFFLKYSLSHPAVTCAIPGMTKLAHLEDNAGAGRGRLPDAAMRKRMEQYWEGLQEIRGG